MSLFWFSNLWFMTSLAWVIMNRFWLVNKLLWVTNFLFLFIYSYLRLSNVMGSDEQLIYVNIPLLVILFMPLATPLHVVQKIYLNVDIHYWMNFNLMSIHFLKIYNLYISQHLDKRKYKLRSKSVSENQD